MMMISRILHRLLTDLEMDLDPKLGMYVNKVTGIPLSIYYDMDSAEVRPIDQTRLPYELRIWKTTDWRDVVVAIKRMIVRGAPLIGCVGAFCLALAARQFRPMKPFEMVENLRNASREIVQVRPTGVDVQNNTRRMIDAANQALVDGLSSSHIAERMEREAISVFIENLVLGKALREHGMAFMNAGDVILTHCNAGSLATPYGGSALGMIEEAAARIPDLLVIVKETRPRCQGYKLTTWELTRAGVPMVIITDNMISSSIERFDVSKILVGADRINREGFVANKIGTHDIAIVGSNHDIPFLVAAPFTTLDINGRGVGGIPIEERDPSEIMAFYHYEAMAMKSEGLLSRQALENWPPHEKVTMKERPSGGEIRLYNPAFDVTPPHLITKVILDIGVFEPSELRALNEVSVRGKVAEVVDRYLNLSGKL